MSQPFLSLNAVTGNANGATHDLEEITEQHAAYVVLSGYTGGTINVYLQVSPDGQNWFSTGATPNAPLTSNGTFYLGKSAADSTPVSALARYVRLLVTYTGGAVGTISGWVLSL